MQTIVLHLGRLKLDLIEKALEENDIEKAKSYFGEVDVTKFMDRWSA